MSCSGCSTGRGNHNVPDGVPAGCQSNGACGTGSGCNKLNVFDWLTDMQLPAGEKPFDIVEVRFKNSRKEFFKNTAGVPLLTGDVVAVEASPGHDMGVVSLTGELVRIQMKKHGIGYDSAEIKKVYRKAKATDIEKWREAQALESQAMFKARTLAIKHGLAMKISDVEYQGDKTKAVFYYTADARVDFRELIKTMAYEFSVRIEMRQIGARQEAARLGGIGSCGRELCCSTWLTDFRTVNTSAARYQQLSLNPLKLAGQCGKLKCCLNYELDSYLDAVKDFPNVENVKLVSKKGKAFHQKTDIFKRMMWFSYEGEASVFIPVSVDRVKKIIEMNKANSFPEEIAEEIKTEAKQIAKPVDFKNVDNQDSLNRFDKKKNPNQRRDGGQKRRPNPNQKPNPNNKPNPNQKANPNQKPNQGNKPHHKPNPNNNNRRPNNNPNNNDKKK
jgi:cell fate regulator YaaT (PSP1 superfamily)